MLPFLLITAVTFLILDYTKGNNVTGFVTFVPDNSVEKEVYNNVINLNEGEYFDFGFSDQTLNKSKKLRYKIESTIPFSVIGFPTIQDSEKFKGKIYTYQHYPNCSVSEINYVEKECVLPYSGGITIIAQTKSELKIIIYEVEL